MRRPPFRALHHRPATGGSPGLLRRFHRAHAAPGSPGRRGRALHALPRGHADLPAQPGLPGHRPAAFGQRRAPEWHPPTWTASPSPTYCAVRANAPATSARPTSRT
ncbi:hypothetical protein BEI_0078 [Halomonas beimenensis]|uniref:Uncharacterized protein n=1 Tax=Halomonas beimenensis TaxID=475662 RepID=A0A291P2H1_9GAMM|nr:hypothetical protein BEI_0078 [Halomonas beimenensis]